ncbi:MAG: hypothetical protein GX620_16480 [Chloroflexi bacterium]|nr:hypothetical protein [Chloroflexota bacterium]
MGRALVAFDTDHIKAYVFGTSKLKEIRGASALLDRLNREEMPGLAGGTTIYANGGAGLFEVEEEQVSHALDSVTQAYQLSTRTGSITGTSVALPGGSANVQAALALLRHQMRAGKDRSTGPTSPLTHPLLHFCDSCGTEYAESTDAAEGEMLCASCAAKRSEDERVRNEIGGWISGQMPLNRSRLWGRLIDDLRRQGDYPIGGYERPPDFNALGRISSPANYMGLIYADGDGMGKVIEGISDLDELRRFADAVDTAVYQVTQEAIATHLIPHNPPHWPFDVLLLGGDDLVMVTRAQSAIEVALHIVERFPAITQELWGTALSLSASVVLAHVNYPIGSLLSLAESCLKTAKQQQSRRRLQGESLTGGLLNFLVVTSSNHLDYREYYNEVLMERTATDGTLYRTQRPYSVDEMHALLARIRSAQQAPRTKVEQLRQAVFKSRKQGTIDAMMAVLRLRNKGHRNALLELAGPREQQLYLPWVKKDGDWVTQVLDVAELIDFVPGEAAI